MQKLATAFLYWVAGGFWWLLDKIYGDAIFEKVRPMIPAWATALSLDVVLDRAISFGPVVTLVGLGGYFFYKGMNQATAEPEAAPQTASVWERYVRPIFVSSLHHPGIQAVIAAMLAGWTILSESWVPIGVVVGIVAYSALARLPRFARKDEGFEPSAIRHAILYLQQEVDALRGPPQDQHILKLISGLQQEEALLKTTIASQERAIEALAASIGKFKEFDRTAFLLATGATQSFFHKHLRDALALIELNPRGSSFKTEQEHMDETERVNDFINELQRKLAPSHWNVDFYRVLENAKSEADHQLPQMSVPEGINPYHFRRFHIACMQYERIQLWLSRVMEDLYAREREMEQLLRERVNIHK